MNKAIENSNLYPDMTFNRTGKLSDLAVVVDRLNNKIDPRLGRQYKVKVQGLDDKGYSTVIMTMNTTEHNALNRRAELEPMLHDYLGDFVKLVKKDFKELTGKALTLKDTDSNIMYNTINFAGEYAVTVMCTYKAKLVEEAELEGDGK